MVAEELLVAECVCGTKQAFWHGDRLLVTCFYCGRTHPAVAERGRLAAVGWRSGLVESDLAAEVAEAGIYSAYSRAGP